MADASSYAGYYESGWSGDASGNESSGNHGWHAFSPPPAPPGVYDGSAQGVPQPLSYAQVASNQADQAVAPQVSDPHSWYNGYYQQQPSVPGQPPSDPPPPPEHNYYSAQPLAPGAPYTGKTSANEMSSEEPPGTESAAANPDPPGLEGMQHNYQHPQYGHYMYPLDSYSHPHQQDMSQYQYPQHRITPPGSSHVASGAPGAPPPYSVASGYSVPGGSAYPQQTSQPYLAEPGPTQGPQQEQQEQPPGFDSQSRPASQQQQQVAPQQQYNQTYPTYSADGNHYGEMASSNPHWYYYGQPTAQQQQQQQPPPPQSQQQQYQATYTAQQSAPATGQTSSTAAGTSQAVSYEQWMSEQQRSAAQASDAGQRLAGSLTEEDIRSVYVKNLPVGVTEDTVKSAMSVFGEVKGVKLRTPKGGQGVGQFAFVEYSNQTEAQAAVQARGVSCSGRMLYISEKKAAPGKVPAWGQPAMAAAAAAVSAKLSAWQAAKAPEQATEEDVPQKDAPAVRKPGFATSGKFQISANPRIGGPLANGVQSRPAYTRAAGASSSKDSQEADTDNSLQPKMFPPSLRAYVERALARCKDNEQKTLCQKIMREMIMRANKEGVLFSKDWDTEPLFPLPDASTLSSLSGAAKAGGAAAAVASPTKRRGKSRWEPEPTTVQSSGPEKDRDSLTDLEDKNGHRSLALPWRPYNAKGSRDTTKRGRSGSGRDRERDASSGSDQSDSEDSRGAANGRPYRLGARMLNTPEEKHRRQKRSKRFETDAATKHSRGGGQQHKTGKGKGRGGQSDANVVAAKLGSGGSASERRAKAQRLAMLAAMGAGGGGGGASDAAAEDLVWDSLTIRGTCQEVEKSYFRLTSAPDPSVVRPEEVLRKALARVVDVMGRRERGYAYALDQLKSIRQDLTVQRIRNEFTAQVYETHGRMALESGDVAEYNQCQTQLKTLYAEGIAGARHEFAAYGLLYLIFKNGSMHDINKLLAYLSPESHQDPGMRHALSVRRAVATGNYLSFFRLYTSAPNLNQRLMDVYVEKMRFEALKCITKAFRPNIPVAVVGRTLGFPPERTEEEEDEGKDEDEDEEDAEEWLRAHGCVLAKIDACLIVDTKASVGTLYMPDPVDAVPHGDSSLQVSDFFAQPMHA